MKRILLFCTAVLLLASFDLIGRNLDSRLFDATLRVDYIFSGTDKTCEIAVDELIRFDGWAGRGVNMSNLPLMGNGSVTMVDAALGDTLYRMSFSSLFQEWQATEEATRMRRSFENVFLLPMPAVAVTITVELYDFRNNVVASMSHPVDPGDILIRPKSVWTMEDDAGGQPAFVGRDGASAEYLLHGGSPEEKIDVVIVAEGYDASEMDFFRSDAQKTVDAIFSHAPFGDLRECFNVLAVEIPSAESGVSVPREGVWRSTAVGSHFDTFYMDRYLTTMRLKNLHDLLAGLPYEHIIILANTDTYGGGGIYNSYTLTTAHHPAFEPVVVHEFGHSFAGLADEYYYDDMYVQYYYSDTEPWERNITTMVDFASKWKDMVEEGSAGLYEGGGYQSKGVWRGADNCRMKTNAAECFCPVCQRAIEDIIRFYTE